MVGAAWKSIPLRSYGSPRVFAPPLAVAPPSACNQASCCCSVNFSSSFPLFIQESTPSDSSSTLNRSLCRFLRQALCSHARSSRPLRQQACQCTQDFNATLFCLKRVRKSGCCRRQHRHVDSWKQACASCIQRAPAVAQVLSPRLTDPLSLSHFIPRLRHHHPTAGFQSPVVFHGCQVQPMQVPFRHPPSTPPPHTCTTATALPRRRAQ